jgi:hypothetical protein
LGRFRRGWQLTKKSWAVLRSHRSLLRFPIYGALSILVVVAIVILPGLYLIDANHSTAGGIALIAVGLYLSSLVGFYFSVGLAATADRIFRGQEATIADGLRVSRERFGAIAGWAAVSMLVGTLTAALEQTEGVGQAIVGYFIDAAWSLITFLAVPVIAIEGIGPLATLKRSASLFRSRWQGQIAGNVAIGGAAALFGVLPAIVLIGVGIYLWSQSGNEGGVAGGAVLVAFGVALLVVSMLIVRALSGIFGVALYRFAADGEAMGGFEPAELESAVKTKN